jgi:hypothetical protein
VRILLLGAVLLVAGCGRQGSASGGGTVTSAPAGGSAGASNAGALPDSAEAAPGDADLVSAVNPVGGGKPVTVKFRLETRPVVGMPVKILVALTPTDDVDLGRVHGSFSPGEGLLVQSAPSFDIADLRSGTPQYQEVTVVPQQTGVLNLDATLLLQTDNTTQTRTYTIPLIAADNSGS